MVTCSYISTQSFMWIFRVLIYCILSKFPLSTSMRATHAHAHGHLAKWSTKYCRWVKLFYWRRFFRHDNVSDSLDIMTTCNITPAITVKTTRIVIWPWSNIDWVWRREYDKCQHRQKKKQIGLTSVVNIKRKWETLSTSQIPYISKNLKAATILSHYGMPFIHQRHSIPPYVRQLINEQGRLKKRV